MLLIKSRFATAEVLDGNHRCLFSLSHDASIFAFCITVDDEKLLQVSKAQLCQAIENVHSDEAEHSFIVELQNIPIARVGLQGKTKDG